MKVGSATTEASVTKVTELEFEAHDSKDEGFIREG